VKPAEPLALNHSWPLFERGLRFDLGLADAPDVDAFPASDDWLANHGIGRWHCDLASQRLDWSLGVYTLFGWARDRPLERTQVLPCYRSESLSAVERLRGYAIRHRRGFTIDAQIHTSDGERWMRVIGAPLCRDQRVVALRGWKIDVTAEYS